MEDATKNAVQKDILEWIKMVKFKKKLFGGLDEDDVLKKMEELNSLYEAALLSERERYNTLLEQATHKGGDL